MGIQKRQLYVIILALISSNVFAGQNQLVGTKIINYGQVSGLVLENELNHFDVYTLSVDFSSKLDLIKGNDNEFTFTLDLGTGFNHSISIKETKIKAEDYLFRYTDEMGTHTYKSSESHWFSGHISDIPESKVRFTIRNNQIMGIIKISDLEIIYIEPVSRFDAHADKDWHLVYSEKDLKSIEGGCGVTAASKVNSESVKFSLDNLHVNDAETCIQAEVALAADHTMVTKMGSISNTENELIDILNLAEINFIYAPLNINHKIVEIHVSNIQNDITQDNEDNIRTVADDFRSWATSGGFVKSYDLASVTINRNLQEGGSYSTIGWAERVGAVCTTDKYCVLEHYYSSMIGNANLEAHEFGHLWNASHTSEVNTTYIMSPTIYTSNYRWHTNSTNSIISHRNSRTCLTTGCAEPPIARIFADQTSICNGVVHFMDVSYLNPTSWSWDFNDGSTSNQQHPSHSFAPGAYLVELTASNSFGSSASSLQVIVQRASGPVVNDVQLCTPGSATLVANGNGKIKWYDDEIAGILVDTGNTYITPTLSANTIYYVEELTTFPLRKVGPVDNSMNTGGYYTSSDYRRMVFSVHKAFTLKSVKVYANSAGNRTFEVVTKIGLKLIDTTIFVPQGESRVQLNFKLMPGSYYGLKVTGTVDLYRNSGSAVYPYRIPGLVTIHETDAKELGFPQYYYFFYDWEVQQRECISKREPVQVVIDCLPGFEEHELSSEIRIYPNPTVNGNIRISFDNNLMDLSDLNIQIFDFTGKLVHSKFPDVQSHNFNINVGKLSPGIYILKTSVKEKTGIHRLVIE